MSYYKYIELQNTTNIYWDPKTGDAKRTFNDLVDITNLQSDIIRELINENNKLVADSNILEGTIQMLDTQLQNMRIALNIVEKKLESVELSMKKLNKEHLK